MQFHELERQDAETLLTITKDILLRFDININNCRGQCYDGAANVAGSINGLQSKIREMEPRALSVHCAAHTIILVVQDSVAEVAAYRDVLIEHRWNVNYFCQRFTKTPSLV